MRIFLDTPMGLAFPVDVDPKDKVYKLKKKVSQRDPTTTSLLKFFFQGKELDQTTTLEDNKIHENSRIFLDLIKKSSRPSRQRGRAPRGGGSGFSVLPLSLWWVIVIIGVIAIAVSYRDAVVMRAPVIDPVVIDPVVIDPVLDVHDDVVPSPPPLSDDEESDPYFIVATQWPNSHVLAKGKSHTLLVPNEATLHGLWPEVEIPSTTPFDSKMGRDRVLIKRASEKWPNLDYRDATNSPIEHNLRFWKYEWDKHGVKSGLIQKVYMELALDIFCQIDPVLNGWLQAIIESGAASTSSSSKRSSSKPIYFKTHDLESVLSVDIAKPRIICWPPDKNNTFHSVHFRVEVKIKGSSGKPTFKFVRMYGRSQCQKTVTLPL